MAHVSLDGVFEAGETAGRRGRERGVADDAAFRLLRNDDRRAVDARLDLAPKLRLGAAARGDDALNPASGRFSMMRRWRAAAKSTPSRTAR
jgi:hypothetical protein